MGREKEKQKKGTKSSSPLHHSNLLYDFSNALITVNKRRAHSSRRKERKEKFYKISSNTFLGLLVQPTIFHHSKFSSLCRHKHKFVYITTSQRLFGRFSGKFALLFFLHLFKIVMQSHVSHVITIHHHDTIRMDANEKERGMKSEKNTHSMRIGGGRQQWMWVKLISRQEREEMSTGHGKKNEMTQEREDAALK